MKYLNLANIVVLVTSIAAIYSPFTVADAAIDALNSNQLNEARTLFLTRLNTAETKSTVLTNLGKLEFYAGNYDKSIDYLQKAISADPDSAVNYLFLGNSYCSKAQTASIFSALGLAKQCISSFEKAHALDTKNTDILQALVGYHSEAPAIVNGSKEKSAQYLLELKKLEPQLAMIYEIKNLDRDKKHDQAIKMALDLKQQEHLSITSRFKLAHYFKENKSYSDAEEILENVIIQSKTNETTYEDRWHISDAQLQLGEIFLETNKQLDRAETLIKDFQKENNNPGHIHYYWAFLSLAKVYKANGKQDQYAATVAHIKTLDYKKDKYFSKAFDKELKN